MMAWLRLNRDDLDSKEKRARHEQATSERLSRIFSSRSRIEDADPDEVEARLRNLSHGTYRE
jgi:hypothetical protein